MMQIEFSAPVGSGVKYFRCGLDVAYRPNRKGKATDEYHFSLYNSQLMLLSDEAYAMSSQDSMSDPICFTFNCNHVWMPGTYFVLVKTPTKKTLRMDFCLDDQHRLTASPVRRCKDGSSDAILNNLRCSPYNWKRLSRMSGMAPLRQYVIDWYREDALRQLREKHFGSQPHRETSFILTTQCVSEMGKVMILLRNVLGLPHKLEMVRCSTLSQPAEPMGPSRADEMFERFRREDEENEPNGLAQVFGMARPSQRMVCLTELSSLLGTGGKTVVGKLLSHLPAPSSSLVLCGTPQEVDALLNEYPALAKTFSTERRLNLTTSTVEEVLCQFFEAVDYYGLLIPEPVEDSLTALVVQSFHQNIVSTWTRKEMNRYVEKYLLAAYYRRALQSMAKGTNPERLMCIEEADLCKEVLLSPVATLGGSLQQLNRMVGLEQVKRSIVTHANRINFLSQRQKLGLHNSTSVPCHAVFTGNPGTGKTTVAKLLGQIYRSLGILSKGDVVCVDRSKLIGKYIGDTEDNMRQTLLEAQGNILFVDEAYTLYAKDSERDFGRHAIECLLTVLSQPSPDMVVIFAGYEKEMDELLAMNPGLAGRFPYHYRFDDYSADELFQMAEHIFQRDDYELSESARTLLKQTISAAVSGKGKDFSNARWIEQYVESGIIPSVADRLAARGQACSREDFSRIEAADVERAFRQFNPNRKKQPARKAVGFCS